MANKPTTTPPSYEVQTYTICEGWVNTWTIIEGDNDPVPHHFATRQEAQAELDELLNDIQQEISCGDRAPDRGYDAEEFRIVGTNLRVTVSFDLRQSIDGRGYKQPDAATFLAMQRAFENWLWYEIEEHWTDIVESTGFEFSEA